MTYPFIQAKHHGPDSNGPITRLVMHGTVTPCAPGWARKVAGAFSITNRDASAHYVIDPSAIYQCLHESTIAYAAPPNDGSIHFELCDPQEGSGARWADANHEAMLVRAAALVRDVAVRYGIPIVKLSSADLLAGRHGICGHVDVTNAWHQTTHIDPGADFPWAHFLDLVKHGPTPEDDMPLTDADVEKIWKYPQPIYQNDKNEAVGNQTSKANVFGYRANNTLDALTTQVTALTAAVKALATSSGADADAIEAVVKKAAESALADLSITLKTDPIP